MPLSRGTLGLAALPLVLAPESVPNLMHTLRTGSLKGLATRGRARERFFINELVVRMTSRPSNSLR